MSVQAKYHPTPDRADRGINQVSVSGFRGLSEHVSSAHEVHAGLIATSRVLREGHGFHSASDRSLAPEVQRNVHAYERTRGHQR